MKRPELLILPLIFAASIIGQIYSLQKKKKSNQPFAKYQLVVLISNILALIALITFTF